MKKNDLKKIWNDPVWSKVISKGILWLLGLFAIFGLIYGWVVIAIIILIIIITSIIFFKKTRFGSYSKSIEINDSTDSKINVSEENLIINEAPTVFFHYRFCDAFPGFNNGFRWFTSQKDIQNRLKILLAHPTMFTKAKGHGIMKDPVWWFRGPYDLYIERFEIINRKKVLINVNEFVIEKIAAYRGIAYYQDFLYVQCLPDKQTGLYKHDPKVIEEEYNKYGEYREEFGIYENRIISRQELDDGSALIKDKPVRIIGAKPRTRELTKYNFIIAAKFSPYNCDKFRKNSPRKFISLLKDEIKFEEFVEWIQRFEKNVYDY